MTEVYDNKSDNINPKFYHNQKVDIISGYYRNNSGIVTGYIVKDGKIYYNIDIIELNIVILVDELDLREIKNVSMFKKMFRK